jgi:hypothetical protein
MRANILRPGGRTVVALATLVLFAGWVGLQPVSAQEPPKKLQREIGLMEDIISDMLVDSPYWLVSSGGPNQGVYLPSYGIVFSLQASLTSGQGSGNNWSLLQGLGIHRHKDHVIVDWDDEDWEDEDDAKAGDDKSNDDAYDRWRANRKKRDDRCYTRGKEELREVLMDAGEMMTQLADGDWVVLAVALEDHRYFRRSRIDQLVLRAKMGDLRARQAGSITDEQLTARIVEEVY